MAKKLAKTDRFLVIVESPTKAKKITKILDEAGYKAIVMASKGHIMQLADKRNSYKNTGIYPDKDFELNLQIEEEHYQLVQDLKAQVERVSKVVIFSDADREGELIGWSLIKFLKLKAGTYYRAATHEITPKAVVAAIENALELDQNLVDAALSRLSIDKLIGYSLTPIAKNYLGVRSVGRCQSIGLKLVVDREKEINNFNPEVYFELFLNFTKNDKQFKAKYDSERITEKYIIDKVISECTGDYIISDIKKREKKESPKPPFCTATFQQEASNRLGLGAKESMSAAQKLFEDGKISYHRTDDTTLAPDFIVDLKDYIIKTYGTFVEPRKGKADKLDQNGHEALRVTDPSLTPEDFNKICSNNSQQKVYKLIWQRTIAAGLPDARIAETKYIITNNGHNFILVSNELIDPGYRKVYNYNDNTDEAPIQDTFELNEVLQNCELEPVTKTTQPPARYTEASLIQQMKAIGVGRPSTYATIVEAVTSKIRGYAEIEDKKIIPTQKGIQLAEFLDRAFPSLINLNYTKEMEEDLDKIANGELTRLEYLTEFFNNLEDAIKNNKELLPLPEATDICPECGSQLVIRRSRFGKLFKGCSNYPNCHHIENIE